MTLVTVPADISVTFDIPEPIPGATGATGPQGPAGADGVAGPQGPAGPGVTLPYTFVPAGSDIQAAIDALPAAGGTITLGAGDHTITTVVTMRGHVTVRGMGRDVTFVLASGCSAFEYVPAVGGQSTDWWMHWEDMTIRGDFTAGKDGIHLSLGSAGGPLYAGALRVRVDRFARYGIYLENDVYVFSARDVEVRDCDSDGIRIADRSNAVRLDNVRSASNNGAGVRILGSSALRVQQATLAGCVIEGNHDGGLLADWADGIGVSGCYFENNSRNNTLCSDGAAHGRTGPGVPAVGYNIRLGTTGTSTVRGVSITGSLFGTGTSAAATGYHIELGDGTSAYAQGVHISGNNFDGDCTKAIRVRTTSDVVVSPANYYAATGDRAMFRGVGTFNGTTGRVITHSLGINTYRVVITPTAALAGTWYVTIASDTFTVKSTSAGDAGAFSWLMVTAS